MPITAATPVTVGMATLSQPAVQKPIDQKLDIKNLEKMVNLLKLAEPSAESLTLQQKCSTAPSPLVKINREFIDIAHPDKKSHEMTQEVLLKTDNLNELTDKELEEKMATFIVKVDKLREVCAIINDQYKQKGTTPEAELEKGNLIPMIPFTSQQNMQALVKACLPHDIPKEIEKRILDNFFSDQPPLINKPSTP